MSGSQSVRFSELVRDNVRVHGLAWSAKYYAKRGLPLWQFCVFAGLPVRSFTV